VPLVDRLETEKREPLPPAEKPSSRSSPKARSTPKAPPAVCMDWSAVPRLDSPSMRRPEPKPSAQARQTGDRGRRGRIAAKAS